MATQTFQKHLDAIERGEVTKTNIIGLRKALNVDSQRYRNHGPTSPQVSSADLYAALSLIVRDNPRVVGELHDSGLKLLRSKRYAKRLANYMDIIEWPSHFELCGFDMIGSRGQYAVPVYRLVGQNGGSFKFINIPWQSGGNGPEVV